jgi:hypothetical protein
MKKIVASVAFALAAAPASAALVTPVKVTASDTFSFFGQYKPENLIDGSGLSADLHDGNFANMWQTNLGVNQANLVFEFDREYALDDVAIWNYNFGNPAEFQSTILRGVKDFRLSASIDGVTYTTIVEARLAMGTGQPLAAQMFDADGFTARFVKLDILNNYGQGTYAERDWNSGLSEVRFTAVPEPASWAMMIGGFAAAGGAMRRRNARVTLA